MRSTSGQTCQDLLTEDLVRRVGLLSEGDVTPPRPRTGLSAKPRAEQSARGLRGSREPRVRFARMRNA